MIAMYHILYVDDEPGLLEIGKLFLEQNGLFSVDTITSAPEALRIILEKGYDAIISDYQMPGMDGIEFLKQVRASGNTVPFIIFTGRGREEVVIQALNEGADFYLQKGGEPVPQFTELADKVQKAVLQRKAEASIRDHERREADIINFLPDATFAIDTNGVVIAWNRAMEKMTGVPADQILGKGNYEYAIPFYHERRPILIDLVLSDDPATESQYPFITRAGKKLFSEITIPHMNDGKGASIWFTTSPLYNTRGVIVGAIESIRDITERKLAELELRAAYEQITATEEELRRQYRELADNERKLRQSEARYRNVVEVQTELISRFLPDGTHVFVNEAYCRYFGKSREEIIGHIFIPDIPVEEQENVKRHFVSLTPSHPVDSIEHRIIMPDSEVRWQRWSDRAIFDTSGTVTEYQSVGRDITEEKTTQTALRESEERYRQLVEQSPDAIIVHKTGRIIYANPACIRLLGAQSSGDLVGQPVLNFVHSDFRHTVIERVRLMTEKKEPVALLEEKFLRLDGTAVDVDVAAIPIVFENEPAIQVTFRDITERKRVEETLRESEVLLRTIIEQSPLSIQVMSPDAWTVQVNHAFEELWGVTFENLKDYNMIKDGQLIRLGIMPYIKRGFSGEAVTFPPVQYDASEILGFGGKRWVQGRIYPVRDTTGTIRNVILVHEDITERKRAEDALRQANRKLTLLSGITRHDIDNQITSLMGFLRILEKKKPDPALSEYFQKISIITKRISAMIWFTKEYENIGIREPVWQDIRSIIRTAAKETPLGKVRIKNDLPAGTEVFADPLIVKVFYNLLGNAVQYGGKITTIRWTVQESGDGHLITCEDDGEGIPAEEKERIFDRGFGKNTGMGLFLAREILSITGITIRETGEPGEGARLEMTVPKGAYRLADVQENHH
ncbi:MAG: PAS domain S-box protein [Methanoregula sp.]|jgi:PAS domain S-box-containing protein